MNHPPARAARSALALLLAINLFNYVDRQVLSAVLWRLQLDGTLFSPVDPDVQLKLGLLSSAFMASYMVVSPVVGWLDGRGYRRWVVLGVGVTGWSLASGATGFATSYWGLFALRCLVGVGEGAYGPVAPALLADAYSPERRGPVMALFNLAIPVGSALGFVVGSVVADYFGDWRPAFWVTFAGLGLGVWCFAKRELPRPSGPAADPPRYAVVLRGLARNRSFVLCTAGMTALTFVLGGLAAWVPTYVLQREARFALTTDRLDELANPPVGAGRRPVPPPVVEKLRPAADGAERDLPGLKQQLAGALTREEAALYLEPVAEVATTPESPRMRMVGVAFGGVVVLGGICGTAAGAWLGERLRRRVPGAYFLVSGAGALAALPFLLGFLHAPLPAGWGLVFLAVCGLFMHTGPAFTLLANVVGPHARATAFAVNILVIHALGDMISPPLIGRMADATNLHTALGLTAAVVLLGGVLWLAGAPGLEADTRRAGGSLDARTTPIARVHR